MGLEWACGQDAKVPNFGFPARARGKWRMSPELWPSGSSGCPQPGWLQPKAEERQVLCSALIWRPSPGVRPVNPGRRLHGGQGLAAVSGWAGDG